MGIYGGEVALNFIGFTTIILNINIPTTTITMTIVPRGRIALWDTGGGWRGEVQVGEGVVEKVTVVKIGIRWY